MLVWQGRAAGAGVGLPCRRARQHPHPLTCTPQGCAASSRSPARAARSRTATASATASGCSTSSPTRRRRRRLRSRARLGRSNPLRFERANKHGRHYTGFAQDLQRRLEQHRADRGARLMEVAVAAGIGFQLVRTWDGDRMLERELKNRHKRCGAAVRSMPGRAARRRLTSHDRRSTRLPSTCASDVRTPWWSMLADAVSWSPTRGLGRPAAGRQRPPRAS
jgi:hypothetical protein